MKTFNRPVSRPSCRPAPVHPPLPRPFDFGFSERRPLAPMSAAALMLDSSPVKVTDLIEEGRLRWAFDIRCRAACRREVRILWQSMLVFSRLYPESAASHQSEAAEFENVIKLILPPGEVPSAAATLPSPHEPVLAATEVARCFCCRSQHVMHLIGEKSLQVINFNSGPKISPLITRASVVRFLKERRIS